MLLAAGVIVPGEHLGRPDRGVRRHAGHADIIREEIDGVAVPALVLTLAGAPADEFLQPYQPAPGTLLA